jgi:hypothetical protein
LGEELVDLSNDGTVSIEVLFERRDKRIIRHMKKEFRPRHLPLFGLNVFLF